MRAVPAIKPSAGVRSIRSCSSRRWRCAAIAKRPYSTKLPASTRSSRFSRAVRPPAAWRRSTASGRASSCVSARRASNSCKSSRSGVVSSGMNASVAGKKVSMTARSALALLAALAALLLVPASGMAAGPFGPLNDLAALGQGGGQTPAAVPVQKPAAPPMDAAPRARRGAGSKPEPSVQGRVPAGSATDGLWCNVKMLSHQGTSGGFKVLRYIDTQGNECAFYDTALLFPANAFNLNSSGVGVAVLDMSDPTKPVQTDTLTEVPMLSPHESVVLNQKRGLLAAVNGNPATEPGLVAIYD